MAGNFAIVYMGVVTLRRTDRPELLLSALLVPLYWVMMALAAVKGAIQLVRDPSYWEKTTHGLGGGATEVAAVEASSPGHAEAEPTATAKPRTQAGPHGLEPVVHLARERSGANGRLLIKLPPAMRAQPWSACARANAGIERGPARDAPGRSRGATGLPWRSDGRRSSAYGEKQALALHQTSRRQGRLCSHRSAFTAFAVLMSLVRHMAFADALTRLNNAESVATSYDPHLAAIGFNYGPVPSALEVPFLALAKIWPNLQIYNVIGAVMTALFAAGTMATVVATARELKLPRFARYGLAAALGLHPIYLVYATNGMAEGINLFFLAVATRFVLRWLDKGQGRDVDLFWASSHSPRHTSPESRPSARAWR